MPGQDANSMPPTQCCKIDTQQNNKHGCFYDVVYPAETIHYQTNY